jgi:COMPASS component SWD2
MDIDRSSTPNGASLNIHRTIGTTASVSNLSDVIGNFRPTKVNPQNPEYDSYGKWSYTLTHCPVM